LDAERSVLRIFYDIVRKANIQKGSLCRACDTVLRTTYLIPVQIYIIFRKFCDIQNGR